MSSNLLFVSIAFPPKNDPECLQTARYFKYLSRDPELTIDVVTSKAPTLFMPVDQGLKKNDSGYRQKIEVPLWETKITNYVLRKLGLGRYLFPDSRMTFYWQWKKVLKRIKHKPDIIYSRSNPMSSAFMAYRLKKQFGCPWVMHLSDPWALSPLHHQKGDMQKKMQRAEEELIRQTEAVTFTSVKTLDLYAAQYPTMKHKFHVLPNVYDAESITEIIPSRETKLTIVYTGGITAQRSVSFLKQVFDELDRIDPDARKKIQFLFAGDVDRENRVFFNSDIPGVAHVGMLPFNEVKKLYDRAHILMVVDNPTSGDQAVFFPSKLLDYFLTRKKILAITPPGSTTREILKGYNHSSFTNMEVKEIAHFLSDSLQSFESGGSAFFSEVIPPLFDAQSNSEKLSLLLKRVVSNT